MKKIFLQTTRLIAVITLIGVLLTQSHVLTNLFRLQTAYAVGDLTVDWGIGTGNVGAIFTIENMAPGDTQSRTVTIDNDSTASRPVGIKGVKTSETGSLADVIDITISDGPTILYDNTLAAFFTASEHPDGIMLTNLPQGASKTMTITTKFQEEAGNEYQNKTLTFNLVIGIVVAIPEECSAIDMTGKFPIYGTAKNETLLGTNGDDVIFGLEGIDKIYGHGGNDCLVGGPGIDRLFGETGNDVLFGNDGNDTMYGGVGEDMLFGGAGNDDMRGENDNDYIEGNSGNDDITGGNGNDEIYGGDGRDDIDGESGNDQLFGGNDQDNLDGGAGDDYIEGNDEKDDLYGQAGNDTLLGGAGIDDIDGHAGIDTCEGERIRRCEL